MAGKALLDSADPRRPPTLTLDDLGYGLHFSAAKQSKTRAGRIESAGGTPGRVGRGWLSVSPNSG